MGLFSFIKEAGEKLFGGKEAEAAQATGNPAAAELNAKAAAAIQTYIEQQNLGLQDLAVTFDGASGKVTRAGRAPSQAAAEKAALAAGNVGSVSSVENGLQFPPEKPSQFHDVVKGDTLSAIARKYYGDASKYPLIFEANRPMRSTPGKIYPGQQLRLPPL